MLIRWIIHMLVSALAFFGVAKIVPGFKIKTFGTAVAVAVVYGLLSTGVHIVLGAMALLTLPVWILSLPVIVLFKPLLILVAPFFCITMALAIFAMSTALIVVTDKLLEDFEIDSISTAVLGSFVYSVLHGVLSAMLR